MSRVSIYLNFDGRAEEAFAFYADLFFGDRADGPISRFSDLPDDMEGPALAGDGA